jgi:putative oxidoreductase
MATNQTKLLYPGLAGFYETMLPIAATLARVVVGVMFLMHVSVKFKIGAAAVAANILAKNGIEPALMWAYVIMFLEVVGGICLIVGLFTRFFAAALAIEMLIALVAVHFAKGYAAGGGGYAIAIRGGGPYSVDRLIGKEL